MLSHKNEIQQRYEKVKSILIDLGNAKNNLTRIIELQKEFQRLKNENKRENYEMISSLIKRSQQYNTIKLPDARTPLVVSIHQPVEQLKLYLSKICEMISRQVIIAKSLLREDANDSKGVKNINRRSIKTINQNSLSLVSMTPAKKSNLVLEMKSGQSSSKSTTSYSLKQSSIISSSTPLSSRSDFKSPLPTPIPRNEDQYVNLRNEDQYVSSWKSSAPKTDPLIINMSETGTSSYQKSSTIISQRSSAIISQMSNYVGQNNSKEKNQNKISNSKVGAHVSESKLKSRSVDGKLNSRSEYNSEHGDLSVGESKFNTHDRKKFEPIITIPQHTPKNKIEQFIFVKNTSPIIRSVPIIDPIDISINVEEVRVILSEYNLKAYLAPECFEFLKQVKLMCVSSIIENMDFYRHYSSTNCDSKINERLSDGKMDERLSDSKMNERLSDGKMDERLSDGKMNERLSDGKMDERLSDGKMNENLSDDETNKEMNNIEAKELNNNNLVMRSSWSKRHGRSPSMFRTGPYKKSNMDLLIYHLKDDKLWQQRLYNKMCNDEQYGTKYDKIKWDKINGFNNNNSTTSSHSRITFELLYQDYYP